MTDSLTEPYFAISESRLKEILRLLRLYHSCINYADVSEQVIRANPVPNNNPVPNSKELTLLAETDWHNREERKHRYEMIPWTMGWMTGFLSERKPYWPKVHEAAIRRDEREKVLDKIVLMTLDRPCTEDYSPNLLGCSGCPFAISYDNGEDCVIRSLRSAATPTVSNKGDINGS